MTHYYVYCATPHCRRLVAVVNDRSQVVRRGNRCTHVGQHVELTRVQLRWLIRNRACTVEAQEVLAV